MHCVRVCMRGLVVVAAVAVVVVMVAVVMVESYCIGITCLLTSGLRDVHTVTFTRSCYSLEAPLYRELIHYGYKGPSCYPLEAPLFRVFIHCRSRLFLVVR